jgi:8-oxo-dGTP pyrophosphatase MutT (NUDIX family)
VTIVRCNNQEKSSKILKGVLASGKITTLFSCIRKRNRTMDVQSMSLSPITGSTKHPLTPNVNHSAFAFITIGQGDSQRYLLQWNAKWGVFNLIGGKVDNSKGDDSSFRLAMHRELEEEMGLKHPEDYLIARELKHIYLSQYSQRHRIFKNYHFCVFVVDIFPNLELDKVQFVRWLSTGRQNVFCSKEEIIQLRTYQNRPISRTTRLILQELGELSGYAC